MLRPMLIQAPRYRYRRHSGMLRPRPRKLVIWIREYANNIFDSRRRYCSGCLCGRGRRLGYVTGRVRSLLFLLGRCWRRVAKDEFLLGPIARAFGAIFNAAITLWSSEIALRLVNHLSYHVKIPLHGFYCLYLDATSAAEVTILAGLACIWHGRGDSALNGFAPLSSSNLPPADYVKNWLVKHSLRWR